MTRRELLAGASAASFVALAAGRAGGAEAAAIAQTPVVWDLTELYPDAAAWRTEYDSVLHAFSGIDAYKGQLGDNARTLADALSLISGLHKRGARLYAYAELKGDEDTRIQENLARKQLAEQLVSKFSEATAWTSPEILGVGERRINSFIQREPRLRPHAFGLHETLRYAPHTLSPETEAVLAAAQLPLDAPDSIYTQLSASDIPWPTIRVGGANVRIDNQAYVLHRQDRDRATRKRVFDTFWGTWKHYESTMGATMAANVQSHVMNAHVRKFGSAREAALFSNALPVAIYDQLIAQAHAGLPTLYRYFQLRGRMLGVTDLAYYDIYPDLLTFNGTYSLDDSKRITLEALAPFGEEYLAILRQGFAARWMHAFPQEGKKSGAYMEGAAYDVHPYLLLNHQGDYDSLSTFAHEWGHAVHTRLTHSAQPYETSDYATFVAEMASTINELLLIRYMQARASTDSEKLFFLGQELEQYRGTFFRQAMFGEFEAQIHATVESGEALTGESLTNMYLALLRTYHGADQGVMRIDPAYAIEWAYIPHFYYNFYVFQYATSVSASTMFTARLLSGDTSAREAVINMLKKGGSEHPHDMFVEAGVDLTTPAPYQAVCARMNAIMDEMGALLDRRTR